MKRNLLLMAAGIIFALPVSSQNQIRGKIIDAATRKPVAEAHIVLQSGKNGTITDSLGFFQFTSTAKTGSFRIERIGYDTLRIPFKAKGKTTQLPLIMLTPRIYNLNEINITAGLVTSRKEPVTVASIKARTIKSRLGDRPLPLILNTIPGVFSVRNGGGSGDASLSIRGFKQENVALLLNGIPLNGLENGLVYWSNWLGLSDAAASIQVQKGPGFSNLATHAVGGSINIITRVKNPVKSGNFSFSITDYGNLKTTLALNSGKLKSGWSISFLGSFYNGPGYVDATYVHGFSYFFSANKQLGRHHHLNITLLGSPQHHGQRTQRLSEQEEQRYGNKYNKDWGSLDGRILNASENFYHKPFLTLTHDWVISKNSKLSNTVYISYGYGGGRWSESFQYAPSVFSYRTPSGQIDWNRIFQQNANNTEKYVLENGDTVSGYSKNVLTNFLASHIQTGLMSTFEHRFCHGFKLTTGMYYNYLNSYLREKITNLLGGKFFIEDYAWSLSGVAGRDQIKTIDDIIKVNNRALISRFSAYTKLSYQTLHWLGYVAINGNDQWYRRIDRFNYIHNIQSQRISKPGYDFRGGISYFPNTQHTFFMNAAWSSRAPYFKYVFGNYNNTPVLHLENEKIKTVEIGYRYIRPALKASASAFYTRWDNVSLLSNEYVQLSDNRQSRAMIHGLNSIHKGIEVQAKYQINNTFTIGAAATWGDYRWQNDVSATLINDNNVVTDTINVYACNLYVGGTAQQQANAFLDFRLFQLFRIYVEWAWYNKRFADFDPINRNNPDDRQQPYSFPAYQIINAGITLPFKAGALPATLQINGYNLLNNIHIETGVDGTHHNSNDFRGFWSFGTNFNFIVKIYI